MSAKAWMVSRGAYSDYEVLAVALTEAEARQWAVAYNAALQSLYREPAYVEEVELYQEGGPLPRSVTWWNADESREWSFTEILSGEPEAPQVHVGGPRGALGRNFPTREAARAAVDQALADARPPDAER